MRLLNKARWQKIRELEMVDDELTIQNAQFLKDMHDFLAYVYSTAMLHIVTKEENSQNIRLKDLVEIFLRVHQMCQDAKSEGEELNLTHSDHGKIMSSKIEKRRVEDFKQKFYEAEQTILAQLGYSLTIESPSSSIAQFFETYRKFEKPEHRDDLKSQIGKHLSLVCSTYLVLFYDPITLAMGIIYIALKKNLKDNVNLPDFEAEKRWFQTLKKDVTEQDLNQISEYYQNFERKLAIDLYEFRQREQMQIESVN